VAGINLKIVHRDRLNANQIKFDIFQKSKGKGKGGQHKDEVDKGKKPAITRNGASPQGQQKRQARVCACLKTKTK